MKRSIVSHATLVATLVYDSQTGLFTRRQARGPSKAGTQAGSLNKNGYVYVTVEYVKYRAHRLAWFYVHGTWPVGEIDHINGEKHDNRIQNLRDVDIAVNRQNLRSAPRRRSRKSPLLGAHWDAQRGKWASSIRSGGKYKHLGVFDTDAEASAAYVAAKRLLHEGCTI